MPIALGEVAGGVVDFKLYLVGEHNRRENEEENGSTLVYDYDKFEWSYQEYAKRPLIGNHYSA